MGIVGDVYQLNVKYAWASNIALNTYFYRAESGTLPTATELQGSFAFIVLGALQGILSEASNIVGVKTTNLFNPEDFVEQEFDDDFPGLASGTTAPSFISASVKTPRKRTDMRPGFKRFPFLSVNAYAGNTITAPMIALMEAVSVQIRADIVAVLATYRPVIVKRIPYVTEGGNDAYRLPENQGEAISYRANEWAVQLRTTSQNSRKVLSV